MPEGPEIRRVADRIARVLTGRMLEGVWFGLPRLVRFSDEIRGWRVLDVDTYGKALLIRLDGGLSLYAHNQLYGVWYVRERGGPRLAAACGWPCTRNRTAPCSTEAEQALTKLSSGLNQRTLKSREQIEKAIKKAVQGASACLLVKIHEERTSERVQLGRGRPGPDTRYEEKHKVNYRLEWMRDEAQIAKAQRSDGLYPLVDNTALEPIEVLRTYKDQPYLEKRFSTKKSVLDVAPVFLERPQRIEAMMFLYYVALMLVSLIERRIRLEMQNRKIDRLPMRPAGMYTKKPTWRTIMDSFDGVHLAAIEQSGKIVHTAVKGMNELRQRILDLLRVPITTYTKLCDGWWRFAIA